jgi:hypothetical protein
MMMLAVIIGLVVFSAVAATVADNRVIRDHHKSEAASRRRLLQELKRHP